MSSLGAGSDISNREETVTYQSGANLYERLCKKAPSGITLERSNHLSVCRGLKKGKTRGHCGLGFFCLFLISFGLGTCEAKENGSFKRNRGGGNKLKSFAIPATCDVASPCRWHILVASRVLSGWRPALCCATEKRQDQILELQVVESNSRTAGNANMGCKEVVLKS